MPKGYPNTPKTPDPAAISHAPDPQYMADSAKPVRSREALDADKFMADFLKNNRPNLVGMEQKLATYGEHPGWVRRWVNDQGSRVQGLIERGWRFVTRDEVGMSDSVGRGNTDIGDKVSVATTAGEGPIRQSLMETPEKLYRMYAEARTAPARATEEAIRKGAFKVSDTANVYNPGERPDSSLYGTHNRIESKSLQ